MYYNIIIIDANFRNISNYNKNICNIRTQFIIPIAFF